MAGQQVARQATSFEMNIIDLFRNLAAALTALQNLM